MRHRDAARALVCITGHQVRQLRVRMGIHVGEARRDVTGLFGLEVHRATRVAAVAHGGQVVLSSTAAELVRDSLPPKASLLDLGLHRLKDLSRPEHLYQLEAEGLATDFPVGALARQPGTGQQLAFSHRPFHRQRARTLRAATTRRVLPARHAHGRRWIRQDPSRPAGGRRTPRRVGRRRLACRVGGGHRRRRRRGDDRPCARDTRAIRASMLDRLLEVLAPQYILIVLDNCEHLIGSCAKLAEADRAPLPPGTPARYEPRIARHRGRNHLPLGRPLSLPDTEALASKEHSGRHAFFLDRARAQGATVAFDDETAQLVASISAARRYAVGDRAGRSPTALDVACRPIGAP